MTFETSPLSAPLHTHTNTHTHTHTHSTLTLTHTNTYTHTLTHTHDQALCHHKSHCVDLTFSLLLLFLSCAPSAASPPFALAACMHTAHALPVLGGLLSRRAAVALRGSPRHIPRVVFLRMMARAASPSSPLSFACMHAGIDLAPSSSFSGQSVAMTLRFR